MPARRTGPLGARSPLVLHQLIPLVQAPEQGTVRSIVVVAVLFWGTIVLLMIDCGCHYPVIQVFLHPALCSQEYGRVGLPVTDIG